MMTGLSVRYDLRSERDEVGRLIGDKPTSHNNAGDKPISQGDANIPLYDLMQDGRGVFLDSSTEGKPSKLVAANTQRIRCVAVDTGLSMLIRPDACIAGAGEENSSDGLEEALSRWFVPIATLPQSRCVLNHFGVRSTSTVSLRGPARSASRSRSISLSKSRPIIPT